MSTEPTGRSHPHPIPLRPPLAEDRPASLPLPLTSFVGRDREVVAVGELVCRPGVRLVTLIGPGGVGKTRLAIRLAGNLGPHFPRGIWFVPLAPVRDLPLVPAAVAAILGLQEARGRPVEDQIKSFLSDGRALLVLDNLEHLPESGPFLADLLSACPGLTLLVTSRAVVGVSGEYVVAVPPLRLPDPAQRLSANEATSSEAVRLFVERAKAARDSFVMTEAKVAAVVAVCRRLDGLPLAIELAAARSRVLPPEALLTYLERWLPLLVGGPRDQPARLQTMRDAIAWSYALLAPAERALFRRLAVFVGGFDLEAARAVAATVNDPAVDVLGGITGLVDQSLLQSAEGTSGRRFTMLETVREFGLEHLAASGEETAARDAHATWCRALAELAGPHLNGPDQHLWMARLETELGNIRAALAWQRERGKAEEALGLANAINWFWTMPGRFQEAREVFEGLIALPSASEYPRALAWAMYTAADLANWLDDEERAAELQERCLALYRQVGSRADIGMVLRGMGSVAIDRGDPVGAINLLTEALDHLRATGATWDVAAATCLIGVAKLALGDHPAAVASLTEALAGWRKIGDTGYEAAALAHLGLVWLAASDVSNAVGAFQEALDLASSNSDRLNLARALGGFGGIAAAQGDLRRAVRLLATATAQFALFGTPRRPPVQAVFDGIVTDLRHRVGEAIFAAEWEAGTALSLGAAVAEARSVEQGAGQPTQQPSAGAGSKPPFGLTRREADVLRLIGEQLTDREIADRLFISRRTASHHVSAVLAKLGVASRRAAIIEARRLGMALPAMEDPPPHIQPEI